MKKLNLFILIVSLIFAMTLIGCASTTTSANTATRNSESQSMLQKENEAQKIKELLYYQSVSKAMGEFSESYSKFGSMLDNYDISKLDIILEAATDSYSKIMAVAEISPPPGYEYAQNSFQQGAQLILESNSNMITSLSLNDEEMGYKAIDQMNEAGQLLVQGVDEIKRILNSHGIEY